MPINSIIPRTRRLFQAIKCFLQSVHLIFFTWNFIALRLLHINFIFQNTIQKSWFNIKLIYIPIVMSWNSQNSSNCIKSSNWSKSFVEIDTFSLHVSLGNQPHLIFLDWTIWSIFDFIDPFQANSFFSLQKSTSSHVWFLSRALISSFMAWHHSLHSTASWNKVGSLIWEKLHLAAHLFEKNCILQLAHKSPSKTSLL